MPKVTLKSSEIANHYHNFYNQSFSKQVEATFEKKNKQTNKK